jgi:outer membrane protein assembly factor BamB
VWEHAYDLTFRSSPIVAGGRLYALDNKGTMHIVELGKSFREVARASLPEEVNATPGFAAGRIFVRTKEHLYCIGGK